MQILPIEETYVPNVGIVKTGHIYFPGKSNISAVQLPNGDVILLGDKSIRRITSNKKPKPKPNEEGLQILWV